MIHANEDQHKIPQVYLKEFGYQDNNQQWKVTVIKRGETFTRHKSVGSFTAETNIFDIESDDPRIPRMFEELNCDLENEYKNILKDLEEEQELSDKSYAFLLQIIANLIVRSDEWRSWVLGILNHENKSNFLKSILAHHCKNIEEFKNIENKEFYKGLAQGNPEDVLNRVLIYFIDYFLFRLKYYEVVLIESQDGKPWFTTTNPVYLELKPGPHDIFQNQSEVYFPISQKYLAYLHHRDSTDQANPLRQLKTNVIYKPSNEQNVQLNHLIVSNNCEYVIVAGKYSYRSTID